MDSGERKSLIDSKFEELDVKAQCDLLGLPRSTFYYRPVAASEQDLAAMRTLDELYQEDPTRGTRRLMQRMRMKTIYCRPLCR